MRSTAATILLALAHPDMRRLQLASASWSAGEAAYLVGLFVFAYAASGPGGVALVAIIRTVPSVVLAPTMAALTSGRPADDSLRATLAVRIAAVALLAVALAAGLPEPLVYLLAALDSIAATFLRPLRGSMLPAVARSPDELVAGNVALTTGDSLANLVGPMLAAACLLLGGPVATFVPGLGLLVLAVLSAMRLHAARPMQTARRTRADAPSGGRLDTVRWLARNPARLVVAMFTIQRLVRGALTVLLVAAAIDLLGMGDPGVGLLTAAIGSGGLVGGFVAFGLVGRTRLAPAFVAGLVIWGLGIALIGLVPIVGIALISLAVGGIGKVLIDVAGYTLLQRTVPNDHRTQVLGIQEGLVTAALALGSVLASVLIEAVGIGSALIIAGALPAVAALVAWPGLRHVDAAVVVPAHEVALIRGVPMFSPLQLSTLEELAAGLEWRTADAGDVVVRQGDLGDRFFMIDLGEVLVEIDGRDSGRLGPGGSFGEIALLRDVPRTATITAETHVRLAAIERTHFIEAVTGHHQSAAAADRLVAELLAP